MVCNTIVRRVGNEMSKFDPQDLKIDELERALNVEMIKNCIMQLMFFLKIPMGKCLWVWRRNF